MLLVSACLAGLNSRYDGRTIADEEICKLITEGKAIPVCPEQMGGLPTPRLPSEIRGGTGNDVLEGRAKVINLKGEDVTDSYIRGAYEVLKLARLVGAEKVILKARSPSCGVGYIYDGTFSGKLVKGNGVTAELLQKEGFLIEAKD